MGRLTRIVIPGLPHHVTQRGNRRSDVFCQAEDRRVYLSLVGKYPGEYGLQIWAYCLMTTHVHFVLMPEPRQALSQAMRDVRAAYA